MKISLIDSYSTNNEFNFKGFGKGFDMEGNEMNNANRIMKAIDEAEQRNNSKDGKKVSNEDTFERETTNKKEEEKEAKTEKEAIKKEFDTAYNNIGSNIAAAHTNPQNKEVEKAWEEMKDMQFNLTKDGVTNSTVINGAAEFITKLEETITLTKTETEENKEFSIYNFSIDAQSDEYTNLFANNPFFTSAYETIKQEKEIAVA